VTGGELLERCRSLGIDLAVGPAGALLWEADDDPPADLLAVLAEHKAELLALLRPPWDQAEADALTAEAVRRRTCLPPPRHAASGREQAWRLG
jgi:hypothetical protein